MTTLLEQNKRLREALENAAEEFHHQWQMWCAVCETDSSRDREKIRDAAWAAYSAAKIAAEPIPQEELRMQNGASIAFSGGAGERYQGIPQEDGELPELPEPHGYMNNPYNQEYPQLPFWLTHAMHAYARAARAHRDGEVAELKRINSYQDSLIDAAKAEIDQLRVKADLYDSVCRQLGIENNILGHVAELSRRLAESEEQVAKLKMVNIRVVAELEQRERIGQALDQLEYGATLTKQEGAKHG